MNGSIASGLLVAVVCWAPSPVGAGPEPRHDGSATRGGAEESLALRSPTRIHPGDTIALPAPLRVTDVMRIARARRAEVLAARAGARAAVQRPAIVSALDDPMISPSIDLPIRPYAPGRSMVGVTVEQWFPLSRVRGHRRDAAEAVARGARADVDRVELDVELEAAAAFWMLAERRAAAVIVEEQRALADQMVSAATARYAASTAAQADVLRAQIEVDRLDAERAVLAAEIRGAEAMLDASLARDPDQPIPALDVTVSDAEPAVTARVASSALAGRPELRAGRAEVERAESEISVMRSMYAPMAMVRTGPAYSWMDGTTGWMVMVGISVPLWRGKLKAGVAEASAMADMANADLDAMRRMISGEAAVARERVAAARARYLALRDRIVPRAKETIAPTFAAYASGQVPLVSAIETTQALWNAQRELIEARAALGLAWARLRRATGESP